MTSARESIRAGRLGEARSALVEAVRNAPSDRESRTLLFQVLALGGEWEKALLHLDALSSQEPAAMAGVELYRALVEGERERDAVAKGERRPAWFPVTPSYVELHFAAAERMGKGEREPALELVARLEEVRPVVSGTVNGSPFRGIRDTDAFLACSLEAMVHGRYVWIPFESLTGLSVEEPKSLFDLIWATARFATVDGMVVHGFLPVLYPGSGRHSDDRVRMGRMTVWEPPEGPFPRAAGQHVYEIGEEEVSLLEIREMTFDNVPTGEKDEERA